MHSLISGCATHDHCQTAYPCIFPTHHNVLYLCDVNVTAISTLSAFQDFVPQAQIGLRK
jgi:hypothetical protein